MKWHGDVFYLLQNLIVKDFKIRYRNMSLGVLWSLLNPLILMSALTFVFTKVYPNNAIENFPIFVLCGLIPFNFFTAAWQNGTLSVTQHAALVKRIPIPREILPIATVLSVCLHLLIQIALLLLLVIVFGRGINVYWFWLPVVWGLEILFVCGLSLITSALEVYVRDVRYIVESSCTLLFWLVPVFYSLGSVPQAYVNIYQYNPIAALIHALRLILIEGQAPGGILLTKLAFSSSLVFFVGLFVFHRLKVRFFDYV